MVYMPSIKEYESLNPNRRAYVSPFAHGNINGNTTGGLFEYLSRRDVYIINLYREIYRALSQDWSIDNTHFNSNQFKKEVYKKYLLLLDLLSEIIMHDPCTERKK